LDIKKTMMARNTIFFTIYCPNNVSPKGAIVNVRSGKKKNGVKVSTMCIRAKFKANLLNKPKINNNPIRVSQIANKRIAILGLIRPKVSSDIVSIAIVSAGLTPGKNFKTPNHRYTIPIQTQGKQFIETRLPSLMANSFISCSLAG
jgi:hypothetical protein